MSVTYVIRFFVRLEQRDRFLDLLAGVLDAMRHEAMFVDAALHRDPEDPCGFLLVETWRDHDDVVNVQLARPYREEWHRALPDLLERPREISVWHRMRLDLAPDHRAAAAAPSSS